MHELSIADSIVRIVCNHAGSRRVTKVEVKIGHLRQVVPSALAFSFELVAAGTVVEGAELAIEDVPVEVLCSICGQTTRSQDFPLSCGECGNLHVEVLRGEEMLVDSLEVDDDSETASLVGAGKGRQGV